MIKAYTAFILFVTGSVVAIAVGMNVPLNTALGIFAISFIAMLAAGLLVVYRPRRKRREWPSLDNDPPAPKLLSQPQRTIRVETPAPKQIEAPGRELVKHS